METFLDLIMSDEHTLKLAICGSEFYRNTINEYEVVYSLRNNIVLTPPNYSCVGECLETFVDSDKINKEKLKDIQFKKIEMADGIIIITGDVCTLSPEILDQLVYAYNLNKKVVFTSMMSGISSEYIFNHDLAHPLYMLKEK